MKAVFFLLALLVVTPALAQHEPKIHQSVVRIYIHTDGDRYPDAFGSGFIVSPTQILTNWHVVARRRQDEIGNDRSIQVRFADGSRSFAAVIHQDEIWDVALLKIHPTKLKPIPFGSDPQPTQTYTTHGFGFDYEYRAREGIMTKTRYVPTQEQAGESPDLFLLEGHAAWRGSSGGPVTGKDGRIVGILHRSNAVLNTTLATNVSRIKIVLGDKLKLGSSDPKSPPYILRSKPPQRVSSPIRPKGDTLLRWVPKIQGYPNDYPL